MTDSSRELKLSAAFVKLADTLTADFDLVDLLQTLVEECAEILDTQAGGLMLLDAADQLQLVGRIEETDLVEVMQLNAGSGPCVECFETGRPVTIGDIAADGSRWPNFQAEALRQGFHSVHAAPMRLRGQILGALNLFSIHVGALPPADIAVAQALADVATIGILQDRNAQQTGTVVAQLQHALDSRILIEQAKGVLSESAGLGMNESFTALRRYSRENNLALRVVAQGVIDRSVDIAAHPATKL